MLLPICIILHFVVQLILSNYSQNLPPARFKLWNNDMGKFLEGVSLGETVQLFIIALVGVSARFGMLVGVILWIISLT